MQRSNVSLRNDIFSKTANGMISAVVMQMTTTRVHVRRERILFMEEAEEEKVLTWKGKIGVAGAGIGGTDSLKTVAVADERDQNEEKDGDGEEETETRGDDWNR